MPAFRGFDHIDCRVRSLAAVESFYDNLMPLLGLSRKRYCFIDAQGDWHEPASGEPYNGVEYYEESSSSGDIAHFIGFIEDPAHVPGKTRIAFRVDHATIAERESDLASLGAHNIERSDDFEVYPALFFEDAAGTKLELTAHHS